MIYHDGSLWIINLPGRWQLMKTFDGIRLGSGISTDRYYKPLWIRFPRAVQRLLDRWHL